MPPLSRRKEAVMASDPNCIFCKIAAGEIPCHKVFENDAGLAFLDVGPLADGHVLWIPRQHYERLDAMPADAVAALCAGLPRLGRAVEDVTQAEGYNVLQNNGEAAGQVVKHVHFHIIPRVAGDGLGYRWLAKEYPAGRAEELADRIRSTLTVP
jgi:histidine triad (HIT) family protein